MLELYTVKISDLGFLPTVLINLSALVKWKGRINKGLESYKIPYKQERGNELHLWSQELQLGVIK